MTAAAITLLAEAVQPRSGRRAWHGGPTPVGALAGAEAQEHLGTRAPHRLLELRRAPPARRKRAGLLSAGPVQLARSPRASRLARMGLRRRPAAGRARPAGGGGPPGRSGKPGTSAAGIEAVDLRRAAGWYRDARRLSHGTDPVDEAALAGAVSRTPRCERCRERKAEVFLSHRREDGLHSVALCATCARRDQGLVLGALIQAQTPGAPPMTDQQEAALRRALDRVGEEEPE
jgi:hypothetical protein